MIHESNVTFLNRARLERQENEKKKKRSFILTFLSRFSFGTPSNWLLC